MPAPGRQRAQPRPRVRPPWRPDGYTGMERCIVRRGTAVDEPNTGGWHQLDFDKCWAENWGCESGSEVSRGMRRHCKQRTQNRYGEYVENFLMGRPLARNQQEAFDSVAQAAFEYHQMVHDEPRSVPAPRLRRQNEQACPELPNFPGRPRRLQSLDAPLEMIQRQPVRYANEGSDSEEEAGPPPPPEEPFPQERMQNEGYLWNPRREDPPQDLHWRPGYWNPPPPPCPPPQLEPQIQPQLEPQIEFQPQFEPQPQPQAEIPMEVDPQNVRRNLFDVPVPRRVLRPRRRINYGP